MVICIIITHDVYDYIILFIRSEILDTDANKDIARFYYFIHSLIFYTRFGIIALLQEFYKYFLLLTKRYIYVIKFVYYFL